MAGSYAANFPVYNKRFAFYSVLEMQQYYCILGVDKSMAFSKPHFVVSAEIEVF